MDTRAMNFLNCVISGISLYLWNTDVISTGDFLIIQSINILGIAFINSNKKK